VGLLSRTLSIRLPDDHPIWSVPGKSRKEVVIKALDLYFNGFGILEEKIVNAVRNGVKAEIQNLREEMRKLKPADQIQEVPPKNTRKRFNRDKWLDF
jgi:hypothetical protein